VIRSKNINRQYNMAIKCKYSRWELLCNKVLLSIRLTATTVDPVEQLNQILEEEWEDEMVLTKI
jgi:hypothetical protein